MICAVVLMAVLSSDAPADVILVSAKIWTGDPARPEAQALAVREGRIVAVGSNTEIEPLKGKKTRVVIALEEKLSQGIEKKIVELAKPGQ